MVPREGCTSWRRPKGSNSGSLTQHSWSGASAGVLPGGTATATQAHPSPRVRGVPQGGTAAATAAAHGPPSADLPQGGIRRAGHTGALPQGSELNGTTAEGEQARQVRHDRAPGKDPEPRPVHGSSKDHYPSTVKDGRALDRQAGGDRQTGAPSKCKDTGAQRHPQVKTRGRTDGKHTRSLSLSKSTDVAPPAMRVGWVGAT
jgi:hypothetical protein